MTQATYLWAVTGSHTYCPFWSCSEWGLHGRHVSMTPVSSYLTISTLPRPNRFGGMFLLHFPYSYLRLTLSGILALWSPDFPRTWCTRSSGLPTCDYIIILYYIIKELRYSISPLSLFINLFSSILLFFKLVIS